MQSSPSLVSIDRADNGVATLWLDRADKRNALDAALMRALAGALDAVRDDPAIRVVVLRGRGPMFSSGIDHSLLLEAFQQSRTVPFAHLHSDLQEVFHRIARMEKPVVAALHRACVGMAFELALACDFRIATRDCVVGLPEVAFGIVPDVGGTTRLVRLAGEARAKELILTGRLVRGETALGYGLVHEVVDAGALDERVAALTATLAAHPPRAVGLAKTLIAAAVETDAATSFRLEGVVQQVLIADPSLPQHFTSALAFIKAQMADAT
jgi:enoyl-CoA hydratase/carnithine racemase